MAFDLLDFVYLATHCFRLLSQPDLNPFSLPVFTAVQLLSSRSAPQALISFEKALRQKLSTMRKAYLKSSAPSSLQSQLESCLLCIFAPQSNFRSEFLTMRTSARTILCPH